MGSFGCVIEVGTGDRSFAVKIGRARYDECPRLCLLAEAAILSLANQNLGSRSRIFTIQM